MRITIRTKIGLLAAGLLVPFVALAVVTELQLRAIDAAFHQTNARDVPSFSAVSRAVAHARWGILGASAAALVVCIAAVFAVSRSLTRRLHQLHSSTRLLADGALPPMKAHRSFDELADLTEAFHQMVAKRHEAEVELLGVQSSLEDRVRQRTDELLWTNAQLQREIEERERAQDELVHAARHDALTGLANRTLLHERVQDCMARQARKRDGAHALLFIDLDNFKLINDSLGHDAGDDLIIQCGQRLMSCIRTTDCAAPANPRNIAGRMGGDEFVILLDDLSEPRGAVHVAERILEQLAAPFDLCGHRISIKCSIGIAFNHGQYARPDDLLRDADAAMYRAKSNGKARFAIFDQSMHQAIYARLQLENDLRKAVENHGLHLVYQPIVDLNHGRPIAFETLARWNHPVRGPISPDEFIAVAEETGLIVPLGRWALQESCRVLDQWWRRLGTDRTPALNVNISRRQMRDPKFMEVVEEALSGLSAPLALLRFEITESAIGDSPQETSEILHRLKDLKIKLHVDDFGVGLSSLSFLREFPFDGLKIDRSFLVRMCRHRQDMAVMHAMVNLAHALGLSVTAEGIEDEAQLASVIALDCDHGQGYLFARPVSEEEAFATIGKVLGMRTPALV